MRKPPTHWSQIFAGRWKRAKIEFPGRNPVRYRLRKWCAILPMVTSKCRCIQQRRDFGGSLATSTDDGCGGKPHTGLTSQPTASFALANTAAFKSSRHSESLKTCNCSDSRLSGEDTKAILMLPSLRSAPSP